MNEAKPFQISKMQVWEAFKRVKANRGAVGVDGQSITDFEEDLKNIKTGRNIEIPGKRDDQLLSFL